MSDKIEKLKNLLWELDGNHNVSVTRTQENINKATLSIAKLFDINIVSFNENKVAVCHNQGCIDQLNGKCHHTLIIYNSCKSKKTK